MVKRGGVRAHSMRWQQRVVKNTYLVQPARYVEKGLSPRAIEGLRQMITLRFFPETESGLQVKRFKSGPRAVFEFAKIYHFGAKTVYKLA